MPLVIEAGINIDRVYKPVGNILEMAKEHRVWQLSLEANLMLDELLEGDLSHSKPVFDTMCKYMVFEYLNFARQLEYTNDSVLRQLLDKLVQTYSSIFQESKQATIASTLQYCDLEMDLARQNDNRPTWHRWSLIKSAVSSAA